MRVATIVSFLALCAALVVRPAGALFFFWSVLVPLLPLVFLVAPGLWRNICPLAAANQTPRLLGFTRGRQQPDFLKFRGYAVAIGLFVLIVASRRPLLDENGTALAVLLLALITAAFVTGATWKGKSGWCSSICPLLPVQRLYGQTPFVTVANSHCQPCVGCTKNCYDFNPGAAYQADLNEPDPDWSAPRKLFAGAFPGVVYGFFTIPAGAGALAMYGHVLLYAAVGAGVLYAADAVLPVSSSKLAVLGAVTAANTFYWYQAPAMASTWGQILGADVEWLSAVLRVGVPALTLLWFVRSLRVERAYADQTGPTAVSVKLSPTRVEQLSATTTGPDGGPAVTFLPDERCIAVSPGTSLLDVAESDDRAVEAGCRMGMCGSDPIAVLDGLDDLSPVGDAEATTLRRLGAGGHVRLACSAKVLGQVRVSLEPADLKRTDVPRTDTERVPVTDPSVRQVVVLGNGIAGVTAVDFVRRNHPDCEIHLVGEEAHTLYNRMAISRVVYGRSAMKGLYLLPDRWYDDNRITCWLNTRAVQLDTAAQTVTLATREQLSYDRLILTTGSSSFVPPIRGFGAPGSFVLRAADDAVAIRRHVQERAASRAVVAGGGLLGLEAAYALHQLGLTTTVLEQGPRLLMRQVDERASEILTSYLANLGIRVVTGTRAEALQSEPAVTAVTTSDGRVLPCEVFLVAAGIVPNVQLAAQAGIEVRRGVVVDARMRTSVPNVFAAGDVAELDGSVHGLWPVAVNQAEVAALNALGAAEASTTTLPPMLLKGVGIDLLSVGRTAPEPGDAVFLLDQGVRHEYAKVIARDGMTVGGMLLGRPGDHDALLQAVRDGEAVTRLLESIPVTSAAEPQPVRT